METEAVVVVDENGVQIKGRFTEEFLAQLAKMMREKVPKVVREVQDVRVQKGSTVRPGSQAGMAVAYLKKTGHPVAFEDLVKIVHPTNVASLRSTLSRLSKTGVVKHAGRSLYEV